jgi:hypothetical protein
MILDDRRKVNSKDVVCMKYYVKCYCNKKITQRGLQVLTIINKTRNKFSKLLLIYKSSTHAKTAVVPSYILTECYCNGRYFGLPHLRIGMNHR